MREVASMASAYGRQQLPASLMQRLALMQHFALMAQSNGHPQSQRTGRGPRPGAQAIVLAWFSLGVLASGAIGVGTVLGLRAKAAGATPFASLAWSAWANALPAGSSAQRDRAWETVEVVIDRSRRAQAPLPLEVTGAADASFGVIVQGLPPGVTPSRGAPVGPSTWVLGAADLDGLYLTLDERAPPAFDLRIALSAAPGVATAGSIVEVRLVDGNGQRPAAATGGTEVASAVPESTGDRPAADRALPEPGAAHAGNSIQRHSVIAAAAPGAPQPDKGGSWPEGASALGAVSHTPARPSWWQMPPPSWSPFLVGQERP
jgi:hypothetical protein